MVFLAGGLIHFGSQVQGITAQSSSESEIIAINSTTKHSFYISSLMGEVGWSQPLKFKLLTDNRSALSLISPGNFSNRSRHIAVSYHALRSWVNEDRIALEHVPTSAMLSDILPRHLVRELQDSIISGLQRGGTPSNNHSTSTSRRAKPSILLFPDFSSSFPRTRREGEYGRFEDASTPRPRRLHLPGSTRQLPDRRN